MFCHHLSSHTNPATPGSQHVGPDSLYSDEVIEKWEKLKQDEGRRRSRTAILEQKVFCRRNPSEQSFQYGLEEQWSIKWRNREIPIS